MLFNSYSFILLFLPIALLGYFFCARASCSAPAKLWLLAASFVFYGYMNPPYVAILAGNILVNYWFSGRLLSAGVAQREQIVQEKDSHRNCGGNENEDSHRNCGGSENEDSHRNCGGNENEDSHRNCGGNENRDQKGNKDGKIWLILALTVNFGALFVFKYYNFFVGNMNRAFAADFTLLHLAIPLGISFITFQQIAYLVDSYRKEIPRYALLDYAVFVAFFPKLISGPIALHKDILPQLEDPGNRQFSSKNFAKGLYAFSFGLAKKMILAGAFAGAASYGFDLETNLTATTAILTILAYTFQIYFDFSGYCDMATGLGWMFNIRIPMNFNSPYKALNIDDFWKRWHMTLTGFFTKYLYFPLGGNRKGRARTYINMMLVFLLSGLWHGAAWTFIFWGFLHGAATVLHRAGRNFFGRLPKWFMWIMTFGFVNAAWVYFRAEAVWQANGILKRALTGGIGGIPAELSVHFLLPEFNFILTPLLNALGDPLSPGLLCLGLFYAFAFFSIWFMKNTDERIRDFVPTRGKAVVCVLLLFWCISSLTQASSFVYFNF